MTEEQAAILILHAETAIEQRQFIIWQLQVVAVEAGFILGWCLWEAIRAGKDAWRLW